MPQLCQRAGGRLVRKTMQSGGRGRKTTQAEGGKKIIKLKRARILKKGMTRRVKAKKSNEDRNVVNDRQNGGGNQQAEGKNHIRPSSVRGVGKQDWDEVIHPLTAWRPKKGPPFSGQGPKQNEGPQCTIHKGGNEAQGWRGGEVVGAEERPNAT